MDYRKFAQKYATEIDGEFREYDNEQSVIVIKLPDDRFQAVQGKIFKHEKYGREVIQLRSTVCRSEEQVDFRAMLAASADYVYSKFVIEDGYVRVEASNFMDGLRESIIKEMIQEAGNLADEWEFKITGKDIF